MALAKESVLDIHHWNDTLFSFRTTRSDSFRFENGHFVMVGLMVDGKPLLRAYSIASPNYEDHLEFFSIKVQDGPLTSRLQHIEVGDEILISKKPVGTLVITDLKPADNLYLFGSGTGLAPYLAIIRDPDTYERFKKVIVVHSVREVSDLAYREYITETLPEHEYLGELVREQLVYYPTVTREAFEHTGRITEIVPNGQLSNDTGLPQLNPETDRAMICGSPSMLKDTAAMLDELGFVASKRIGDVAHYVIERAFVE
ncbi:MAG: ferredoxin--NADP reductase [Pseudomonadota bacterium]